MTTKDEIISKMDEIGARYILLQFTGADGNLKGVELSHRAFREASDIGVDGSSIGFLRTKQSDMIISPDPQAVFKIPWTEDTVCVFCDLKSTNKHERITRDPRGILAKVTEELKEKFNANYYARPEMEFYFLDMNLKSTDNAGYMELPPKDKGYFLRKEIVETLEEIGLPYKTFHSEVGPGQHEIEFSFLPAIQAADGVQLFKQIAKMVAIMETGDWQTTFMPKPFIDKAGSGLHIHQMIIDDEGKNLFMAESNKFSDFFRFFIGGQLKHAAEITAVTNPIVNSYRRLIPGVEAPVYITWGIANRTALLRVPGYESGRLEYRAADASTNIYFSLALLLAAGLEGVENQIEPPKPADFDADALSLEELKERNVELLPRTLEQSLEKFKESKLVKRVLGSELQKEFYDVKMNEWKEFTSEYSFEKKEITNWELTRYINV